MGADYNKAKKMADAAVKNAEKLDISPYLPVLDEIPKDVAGEIKIGLLELPVSAVVGNKSKGRNSAFANNFMPLLEGSTEFGMKWSALYDSYRNEGIRDAIKVYEYLNKYYVEEGNKRVSVSKYGGSEYILADVTRILPKKTEEKAIRAYYEYLDFFRSTGNCYIVFTEPGAYKKLAGIVGQTLGQPWPKDVCDSLKAAFFGFRNGCETVLKARTDFTVGDAFLSYISLFPLRSLLEDSRDQIAQNIKLARKELVAQQDIEKLNFVNTTEPSVEEKKRTKFLQNFFSKGRNYSENSPLRVAFIYNADIDASRWINSHEAGNLYMKAMFGNIVDTKTYISGENLSETLEKALSDKPEIVFAVSPDMTDEVLKTAMHHPETAFFNCRPASTHSLVRCYHGKLYEAAFLMGILAADELLRNGEGHKIAYLIRSEEEINVADINAFAIGASLIDPKSKIILTYKNGQPKSEIRREWIRENISVYADIEYPSLSGMAERPGVFRIDGGEDGKDIYIGKPYFNWGKYYSQIVQSFISGIWDEFEADHEYEAKNLWFGLSTGVVDISLPSDVSYQTRKLLMFFKNAVAGGETGPFSGELHSQTAVIQEERAVKGSGFTISLENMPEGKIASMNWLNENVVGSLPEKIK